MERVCQQLQGSRRDGVKHQDAIRMKQMHLRTAIVRDR